MYTCKGWGMTLREKQNFSKQQVNEKNTVCKFACPEICVRDEGTLRQRQKQK